MFSWEVTQEMFYAIWFTVGLGVSLSALTGTLEAYREDGFNPPFRILLGIFLSWSGETLARGYFLLFLIQGSFAWLTITLISPIIVFSAVLIVAGGCFHKHTLDKKWIRWLVGGIAFAVLLEILKIT